MKKYINRILFRFGYQFKKNDNGFSLNRNIDWLLNYPIKTIFDIGANEGQFAEFILGIFPNSQVYCFEPLSECYDKLCKKFRNISNVKAFNMALGELSEKQNMYLNEFTPSSSLLKMKQEHITNFPFTEKTKIENIIVKTLDNMYTDLTIKDEVLVKIDVQGFEGKVLNGGMKFFSNIPKIVIVETSIIQLYENEISFDEIYETFKSLGYCYSGNMNQLYSPLDGKILQVDSIFIK